jgi:hypothetical protein
MRPPLLGLHQNAKARRKRKQLIFNISETPMKLRPFIVVYSAALLLWLGLTFVTPQPAQRYRPTDATSAKTAAPKPESTDETKAANSDSKPAWTVSASH